MCDVVSLMIAGTAVTAAGQIQQGLAAGAAGRASRDIAYQNALFAEERAADALARGGEQVDAIRREGQQVKGQQEAAFSSGNIDVAFGSPLDTIVSSATAVELDARRAQRNSQLEAQDFRQQAWNYRAQGEMDAAAGRNQRTGSFLSAGGTVLTGGSKAFRYQSAVA